MERRRKILDAAVTLFQFMNTDFNFMKEGNFSVNAQNTCHECKYQYGRDDAINMIITSIAMEELSIAHIWNAEGEKLQNVINTIEPGTSTLAGQLLWFLFLLPQQIASFSFPDVPQFDGEGSPFVYIINENPITGYETKIDGFHIANTRE